MSETLRQLAHTNKKVIALVEHDLHPFMEDSWKRLSKNLKPLQYYLKPIDSKTQNVLQQDTFLEFIEKSVIIDFLTEPFLFKNFIQHQSFPYNPEDFLGKETAVLNYFTFWKHYQNKYQQKLSRIALLEEEYEKHQMETG